VEPGGDSYFNGGWFMYFTPRELAKFGLQYLHGRQRWRDPVHVDVWLTVILSPQSTEFSRGNSIEKLVETVVGSKGRSKREAKATTKESSLEDWVRPSFGR
jgi:hypothetical protein